MSVEQHQNPRLVDRGKDNLPDGECGVRISECSSLGANVDADGCIGAVDFERVSLEAEGQLKVIQKLQGICPGFEETILIAEDGRSTANDIEKCSKLSSAFELETALPRGELGHQMVSGLGPSYDGGF